MTTMMALILMSLLASFAGDAVVALSPGTNVAPTQAGDGGNDFPPKP
jgi:hypothetical protein